MAEFGENSGRQAEEHDGTNSRNVPEPLCGTGDSSVTVPRGPWSSHHEQRKKVVLHVDLNNTILVSDAVTGQGTVAALEYFLTTVTWGKMNKHGKLEIDSIVIYNITQECLECVCSIDNMHVCVCVCARARTLSQVLAGKLLLLWC